MKRVAVTTVRDDGAAQVAKEALVAIGIDVEVKRMSNVTAFGAVSAAVWEVRVPEDSIEAAEQELARLEGEAETALRSQAGGDDEQKSDDDRRIEENLAARRRRNFPWAIVLLVAVVLAMIAYFRAPYTPRPEHKGDVNGAQP
jgi:hypothetical protein